MNVANGPRICSPLSRLCYELLLDIASSSLDVPSCQLRFATCLPKTVYIKPLIRVSFLQQPLSRYVAINTLGFAHSLT